MAKTLKVTIWKISDINPASYNPRDISDSAFQGLCESIKKFGMVDPLIVNVKDKKNVLVGGHQRLKAADHVGLDEVPVVEVSLTVAEEKALNITLNNPKIAGTYNETLSDLIEEVRSELGDDFLNDLQMNEIVVPDLDFDPGNKDEQGQLDQKKLVFMICPHCDEKFEQGQARVIKD